MNLHLDSCLQVPRQRASNERKLDPRRNPGARDLGVSLHLGRIGCARLKMGDDSEEDSGNN